MKGMIRKEAWMLIFVALFAVTLACPDLGQAVVGDKDDYAKLPAFLETGLDPNLLLLIDNSASMYDQAYVDSSGSDCFADDFDPTVAYAGYFDSTADTWYKYDLSDDRFESITMTGACTSSAAYAHSDLCLILDAGDNVTWVRATGRFWNWLAASKFDVEKEILTGGKYDSDNAQLVMESRGCLEERFVKQVPVSKGGVDYKATFGIRPPDTTEQAEDLAYYTTSPTISTTRSTSTTRIEIFKPTTDGFNSTECDEAIDYWSTAGANLGTLKDKTQDCLVGQDQSTPVDLIGVTASHTAFNHILQECWYFKAHGDFQSGLGSVTSLKTDCEAVYGTLGDADYQSPETLNASEVCSGQYDSDGSARWGYGFVGQCWEPAYASPWQDDTCAVGDEAVAKSKLSAVSDAFGKYYYCDEAALVYMECNAKPNPSNGDCKEKGLDAWHVRQVPAVGSSVPISVGWTDDDMGDGGDDTDNNPGGEQPGHTCVESALRSYCQDLDDVTIVDPDVSDPLGTSWSVPAVLIDAAVEAQLGQPLETLKGRLYNATPDNASPANEVKASPIGLVQEFKYNMRLGAMEFNIGSAAECASTLRSDGTYRATLYDCLTDKGSYITSTSVPDTSQLDGGRIVSYIDDEDDGHNSALVDALNAIEANAWTPTAEALYNAVGYYTQDNGGTAAAGAEADDLRINGRSDFIWDHDAPDLSVSAWNEGTTYAAGERVTFTYDHDGDGNATDTKLYFTRNGGTSTVGAASIMEDIDVNWTPYDPVLAGCQSNNILLITDGASTADMKSIMTTFARANGDGGVIGDGDSECKTVTDESALYGSTMMDDLTHYASQNGNAIYPAGYQKVATKDKQPIKTYVVAAGTLENEDTTECNAKTQLANATTNSGTTLLESTNPDELEENLRDVFEAIGGEVSSGSAASVISHSRSGDGAIYQAIFYPLQVDDHLNEVFWTGDVHSLWLDSAGNIREDCGDVDCSTDGDKIMDPTKDNIIEFYTDAGGSARVRRLVDADGDGEDDYACSNTTYTNETECLANSGTWDRVVAEEDLLLKDLNYLWSGADWLAEASAVQRAYNSNVMARYIFTMLPDGSGNPAMVPFTSTGLKTALTTLGKSYSAYFNAADDTEASAIVNYIRGEDQSYRSRQIDWTPDAGLETVKLGDIIHSTPTLVGAPAENYDVIYGDPTYRTFRKKYQKRRAVVYAGGNDGGLHAFNAGYYNRHTKEFLNRPDPGFVDYDLGAELWMYVPKNVFPHLRWLTEDDYDNDSHNYYIDAKPYIFDAKVFTPSTIHPGGWGTLLMAGMRYGGGKITVGGDTMRSAYFILDITDPEVPPVVLAEFTDADLGYTTGSPTAIPMLRCDITTLAGIGTCTTSGWPMDWYLTFGSGPHDDAAGRAGPQGGMQALSDQNGKVYVMELGGTGTPALANVGSGQQPIGTALTWGTPPNLIAKFSPGACSDSTSLNETTCSGAGGTWTPDLDNSFFGDFISVDYDLDFNVDSLYFGSVYDALSGGHDSHKGALHRLVVGDDLDPDTWRVNTFYDVGSPVTAAPSVATDGNRAWVYFGTGRLFSGKEDKQILATTPPTQFLGLKERYDEYGVMDLDLPNGGLLVDVTDVWVAEGSGALAPTPITAQNLLTGAAAVNLLNDDSSAVAKFTELNEVMDSLQASGSGYEDVYHGWRIKLDSGERVLGQPAILGDIVTFTSYIPSNDPCEPEGVSFLWAPYFRTGTAFYRSVIGTEANGSEQEVLRKISIGKGLATTPNIHTGSDDGTKAFVQSSTGAIISIEQTNPGVVKSGMRSWREMGD